MDFRKVLLIAIIVMLSVFAGCEDEDDSSSSGGSSSSKIGDTLKAAAQDVLPDFSGSGGRVLNTDWTWGNPLFEIYAVLKKYDGGSDVGLENINKVLDQAADFVNEIESQTQEVTKQVIKPPFDFGNNVEYTRAANKLQTAYGDHSYAYHKEGDVLYVMFSWKMTNDSGTEYGVFEGNYNESTHDLDIDLVCYVDYTNGNDYSMRHEIKGNDNDHSFDIRMMKYNPNGFQMALNGKGVSEGADKGFLFYGEFTEGGSTSKGYYCFLTSDTETQLKAKDVTPETTVASDSVCIEYQTNVDEKVLFTSANLPTAASSFSGTSDSPIAITFTE